MRKIIRQSFICIMGVILISSCQGRLRFFPKQVDESAFHIEEANIVENGKKETGQAVEAVEMVRIGVLLPLTGSSAKLGRALNKRPALCLKTRQAIKHLPCYLCKSKTLLFG